MLNRTLYAAAVGAAALVLAGCGDQATTGSSSPSSTTTAASPTPTSTGGDPSDQPTAADPTSLDPSSLAVPVTPKGSVPGAKPLESVKAQLQVSVMSARGATPKTWELRCDPVGGTHPNALAACAALAKAGGASAMTLPTNLSCTEQYGGDAVATIKGTIDGQSVNATLNQVNGCHIAQWNALAPVLGAYSPGS